MHFAACISRRFLLVALVLNGMSLSSRAGEASAPRNMNPRPSAPVGLLVDGVNHPLAIDRDTAQFTWMSPDSGRNERQTAYQIVIYSNAPEPSAVSTSVWWDSGKVVSAQSASIPYPGKALPAATRFWWEVRIWNQDGRPGPYSIPSYFDTGLSRNDWTAQYIWDGTTNLNNFAYFRKTFVVAQRPELAKVFVTAHDEYELSCNGWLLGQGPARCDPYFHGQYNAYDITKLLEPGTNVIAAIGHWQGIWNNGGVVGRPAFLLEARLSYPDGSSATIGSDSSWRVLTHTGFIETNAAYFSSGGPRKRSNPAARPTSTGAVPAGNLDDRRLASTTVIVRTDYHTTFENYGGATGSSNRPAIQFDARREPVGWQETDFADSDWLPATVMGLPDYHLFAQMAPMENEQAELKPVTMTSTNGAWLVDFGRCINGWPKLTMHANHSGDVVRIEYFQMAGEQDPAGWDEYHCRGGEETWKPDFGRHTSFEVIKISGYAGVLQAQDVRGIWAYSDADVAGHFHCSSDLLNRIYEMCERSARQNVQQGIISVDANREQSQWTADSWNIGNVLLYNDRDTMMLDKIVRDYAAGQLPNGDFPACCPAQRSRCIPEWSMYWPMLLWQQYLFSGDEQLLREMAPRLARFLEWLRRFQDPETKLIDPPGWRISEYAGGDMPGGGYNIATACQYYENLCIASRISAVLAEKKQSDDYLRQAEAVKSGINSHLFNGQFYLARTDRTEMFPLASAWALRFDLVPETARPVVLAVVEKAGKPNLGGYGGDAFYSGMLNGGGGAFVVRDLDRYRFMLRGNKANAESFVPGHGEVNHAWTTYPGYLFLKYVSGIQPTSGGFATFDIRPETGGLTFAEGTVPTVKGLVMTRWEKKPNGAFELSVTVPPNTRASVYVPNLTNGDVIVTESGKELWPPQPGITDSGVLAVSEEDSSIRCLVNAGSYQFNELPGHL